MNILITCLSFSQLTGSELYFYDLACGLKKLGHKVSIISNLSNGSLYKRANKRGIKCFHFAATPQDLQVDVILASHRSIVSAIITQKMFPGIPLIQICHSEIIPEELPVVDARVKHYVVIRPAIAELLKNNYFIDETQISLIWNPINIKRLMSVKFRPLDVAHKNVLFPGTIDYLRKNAILDMYEKCKQEGSHLTVIGKKHMDYLDRLDSSVITVLDAVNDMTPFYVKATHIAGIMYGRTAIEGFFYNLPYYNYNVDAMGVVIGMQEMEPPADQREHQERHDHVGVALSVSVLCEEVIEQSKLALV